MAITKLSFTDVHADVINDCARCLMNSAAMVSMPALETLCAKLNKLADEIRQLNIEQRANGYDVQRDYDIFTKLDQYNELWTSPEMNTPIVRAANGFTKRNISLCREAAAHRIQAEHYGRSNVVLSHRRAANE